MQQTTIYLKCDMDIEVNKEEVYLSDIAEVRCANTELATRCRALKVHTFRKDAPSRVVISVLKIVAMIEEISPTCNVRSVGECDVLIEHVGKRRQKWCLRWGMIALVSAVAFFGTAFTIMAYHNVVDIHGIFQTAYQVFGQPQPDGPAIVEIAYSVGLGLGIIVFFNHIGTRRITRDPTPIEVAMRDYEDEVNRALIEQAARENETIRSDEKSGKEGKKENDRRGPKDDARK
jgi:stage V sporulation protein AA